MITVYHIKGKRSFIPAGKRAGRRDDPAGIAGSPVFLSNNPQGCNEFVFGGINK